MGEVRAYNVATNTWTSKRDMPAARYGMNGAGVIDGKIYVTGGFAEPASQGPSASVFVYNPASNTWTRKRDMPAAGGYGVTGVIGGKLYVVTFSSYLGIAKWPTSSGITRPRIRGPGSRAPPVTSTVDGAGA